MLNKDIIRNFINQQTELAAASEAVNNDFYTLWNKHPLNVKKAEIFLANYFARTINTVARVWDVTRALLDPIKIIKNSDYAKVVINNLENLHDELGNGKEKKPHPVLMAEWINILLKN